MCTRLNFVVVVAASSTVVNGRRPSDGRTNDDNSSSSYIELEATYVVSHLILVAYHFLFDLLCLLASLLPECVYRVFHEGPHTLSFYGIGWRLHVVKHSVYLKCCCCCWMDRIWLSREGRKAEYTTAIYYEVFREELLHCPLPRLQSRAQ